MSDKIKIFGELESGAVDGYVVDKTAVKGLSEIERAVTAGDVTAAQLNSSTSKIEFKNAAGTKLFEIDARPFIKDGMLKSVEISGGNIVFTFNEDGINPISIPLADIFNPNNYYSKTEIDEMAGDIKTKEAITVAGGPLADDTSDNWPTAWKDSAGNKVIPAGLSLEDVLTNLFLKVINGTVSWGAISWSPTLAAPTITMAAANTTVEVGTSVSATAAVNSAVSNNVRKSTLTASQGYFESLDGEWKNAAKSESKNGTTSGTASVKKYWNGTETTNTSHVVVEGSNTFKADQAGITAAVEELPQTEVWASTNTKQLAKTDDGAYITAKVPSNSAATKALTSTASKSVTGSFKYYIGYADSVPTTTDAVKALTTHSGWVSNTISIGKGTAPAGKYMVIAIPAEYSLNEVKNGMDLPITDNFYVAGVKEPATLEYVLANGAKKNYKIYSNLYGADVAYNSITIKK